METMNAAISMKVVVKSKFKYLKDNLDLKDILDVLYEDKIVTKQQYEHLVQEEQNKGATYQVELFLKYLLDGESKDGNKKMEKFMKLLKLTQPWIHEELVKVIEEGYISLGLRDQMVKTYREIKFNKIQSLPGEKFHLDLHKTDFVMPLEFTAEQYKPDDKTSAVLDEEYWDKKYFPATFKSVDEIVGALQKHSQRSILCTALAGCGKTTLVHRLVCQWMKNADEMKEYDSVFSIAIRDVDFDLSLLETLGSTRHGLGYLDEDSIECLSSCLGTPQLASKLLFILDGVDERTIPEDSDIYKLITGEIHPNVKVFITSRPEAPILENLQKLHHAYKIEIKGTTKAGVYQYLRNIIHCQQSFEITQHNTTGPTLDGMSQTLKEKQSTQVNTSTKQDSCAQDDIHAEIKRLIKECENKMVTFNLLKIPLYLTLTGYVFSEHWAKYLTFAGFILPDTTTKLFNSIFLILLRHWLKRIGRDKEADTLNFSKNPLGLDSNLCKDIKMKLFIMGRMSYDLIMDQQYTFTSDDLDKNFIDIDDIQQSGLFCLAQHKDESVGFFRHKQLQEYMAGLYLSHEKLNCYSFAQFIARDKIRQKLPLLQIFGKISNVLPFAFGLCSDIPGILLNELQNDLSVSLWNNHIDLHYEALLFCEANDDKVQQKLLQILPNCLSIRSPISAFNTSNIHKLCTSFSLEQTASLLQKWYGFRIFKQDNHWAIHNYQPQRNKLTIAALDFTLYCFLQHFKFPEIHHVTINESDVLDIQMIQSIFPQVTHLFMMSHTLRKTEGKVKKLFVQNEIQPTFTHLHINDTKSNPQFSFLGILKQSHLQSLTLAFIDILKFLDPSQHEVLWTQLKMLQITVKSELEDYILNKTLFTHLSWLLQQTPKLESLNLHFENGLLASQLYLIGELVDCIKHHLPRLHTLSLYQVVNNKQAEELCSHLLQLPPQVKTLKVCSLDELDLFEIESDHITWKKALRSLKNINSEIFNSFQVFSQFVNPDWSTSFTTN